MSGVWVLGELLTADEDLTALVGDNIKGGALGADEGLPAVSLNRISAMPLRVLTPGSKRRVSERVQATAMARNYEEMTDVIRLTRNAAAAQIGDFAGVTEVSVQLDEAGPDFILEDPTIWCGSQDFIVSYNEA